eukprot:2163655-Amphidinium_carterae.1
MVWHEEPDTLQFQNLQQPTGTPAQPAPTQMGTLYNVGAVININEQAPSYKELWAIVLDSGAAVLVCPQSFCPHVPITTMTEEARKQYVTVTGEGLDITGWKETTMVIGKVLMQVRFIVANVQSPLIGLPDLDNNEICNAHGQ